MGVRILHDTENGMACLYCSTSDVAFGPLFSDGEDGYYADERAEAFLRWLDMTPEWANFPKDNPFGDGGRDARLLSDSGLQSAYSAWLAQESAQWAREDAPDQEA